MTRILTLLITCLLLVGCTSSSIAPASTSTSAPTALPTNTPTPTPEPTPTPTPIDGLLFFDMNGSGLKDEASFQYDAARLADERQPLQPDLLAAINAYLVEHPDIKDGDLVTLMEPGLSGYTVCAGSNCVNTDAEGRFQLLMPEAGRSVNINIKDPNAGTPALEMRYINKWKRAVVIPAYEMNGVQVPEQHLNDTSIFELADGLELIPGKPNETGLMQGFLTLPFVGEESEEIYIFNYFDIIGNRLFNSEVNYWNAMDGKMLTFDGKYTDHFSPDPYFLGANVKPGVSDTHNGLDFLVNIGQYIVASSPKSTVWGLPIIDTGELQVQLEFIDPEGADYFADTYGHLLVQLVHRSQDVYRGQIIGLSGNSGSKSGHFPQLHFDLFLQTQRGSYHYDPFRCTVTINESIEDFWGSEVSYWTVDNLPVFSK